MDESMEPGTSRSDPNIDSPVYRLIAMWCCVRHPSGHMARRPARAENLGLARRPAGFRPGPARSKFASARPGPAH
uniref:Protein kinase domain-containing protein n=1 Tax=Bursaphelenchus xylophilus TaxID=6326 RepID=A0A1I7SCS0_BURXY